MGVAHQAPPSMGFSRQECWNGLPIPSPFFFFPNLYCFLGSACFLFALFLKKIFIYLFLAVLGLRYCGLFSSCGEQGLL